MPALSPDPDFYRSLFSAFRDDPPSGPDVDPGMNRPDYFSFDGSVGRHGDNRRPDVIQARSEEHTSELQSLMRTSYAVFCLKKQNENTTVNIDNISTN